jgi:hypothetical protein
MRNDYNILLLHPCNNIALYVLYGLVVDKKEKQARNLLFADQAAEKGEVFLPWSFTILPLLAGH